MTQRLKPGTTPEQLGATLGIDPSKVTVSGGQYESFRAGWAVVMFSEGDEAHYYRRRAHNIAEAKSLCGLTAEVRRLYGPGNYEQCGKCRRQVQKGRA